ncbi:hypothetical protein CTheo_4909 [Ceratobasidium theobromae]|uniref:Transmembrane protein n=1 Tax=Ceratobasidium theobromae TaxID=1582974 RepID=A0A5N5QK44_9AGAM|nr:hypothetical protein CTheo_4909 [Ceratobasidium theobromae]
MSSPVRKPSCMKQRALAGSEMLPYAQANVHFPTAKRELVKTRVTHSPASYDRSPIVVSPNTCALPARGCPGRTYDPRIRRSPTPCPALVPDEGSSDDSDGLTSPPPERIPAFDDDRALLFAASRKPKLRRRDEFGSDEGCPPASARFIPPRFPIHSLIPLPEVALPRFAILLLVFFICLKQFQSPFQPFHTGWMRKTQCHLMHVSSPLALSVLPLAIFFLFVVTTGPSQFQPRDSFRFCIAYPSRQIPAHHALCALPHSLPDPRAGQGALPLLKQLGRRTPAANFHCFVTLCAHVSRKQAKSVTSWLFGDNNPETRAGLESAGCAAELRTASVLSGRYAAIGSATSYRWVVRRLPSWTLCRYTHIHSDAYNYEITHIQCILRNWNARQALFQFEPGDRDVKYMRGLRMHFGFEDVFLGAGPPAQAVFAAAEC